MWSALPARRRYAGTSSRHGARQWRRRPFDGKVGVDTALFSGTIANYAISKAANGVVTVADRRAGSPDGVDTLSNFEFARFANGVIDLKTMRHLTPPHSLNLSSTTVSENVRVGTLVGVLSALDTEGGALTYRLLNSAGGLFTLSGTRLLVARAIDYERVPAAGITVQVVDSGGLSATRTFRITIADMLETIRGSARAETLLGGIGRDAILGLGGNDAVHGNAGNDLLYGGIGNDTLLGGPGNDLLDGGPGADRSFGGTGNDLHVVDNADACLRVGRRGHRSGPGARQPCAGRQCRKPGSSRIDPINGAGNALDNIVTGSAMANVLE